ncbi:MAG: hypothetical protein GY716_19360 [bacterium]|nr:hypothetical protein [bacterium]
MRQEETSSERQAGDQEPRHRGDEHLAAERDADGPGKKSRAIGTVSTAVASGRVARCFQDRSSAATD